MKLWEFARLLCNGYDLDVYRSEVEGPYRWRSEQPLPDELADREIRKIMSTSGKTIVYLEDAQSEHAEGGTQAATPVESVIAVTKEIKIRVTLEIEGMDDEAIEPI